MAGTDDWGKSKYWAIWGNALGQYCTWEGSNQQLCLGANQDFLQHRYWQRADYRGGQEWVKQLQQPENSRSNRSINSTSSKLSNSKNFHINTKNIQATTNIHEARREPTHAHRSPFNYPHSLPVSSCRRLDGRGRWWWGHSSICSSQVRGGCQSR